MTYSAKPKDIVRKWYLVDASELTLGRLSTKVAAMLMGKEKPMFTKHIDCGDYVIIINADSLVVSGEKKDKKSYFRYTGFPGGIKETKLKDVINQDSTKAIVSSVRGMLPANKLRDDRLSRLKVYSGAEHNHTAQKPIKITLKESK
ncbi:50S ribosomal protein L13 [Candidatus Saccharibacteria bacterium]|nr:50S ribosomal protein L13 [Candidatus Saccharibacteria bacterium]